MLQAGRLPACLHGLAGNGVWLLSLDLKEVERAVRDLGALPPGTCTCSTDLSLAAHQAAHRPPSSQQSDLVHNASLYALAMGFCTLEAAVPHPDTSGLRQPHTAAAAAAAGQCSDILSGCSLPFSTPAAVHDGCRALNITSCPPCGAGEITWAQRAAIACL